MRLVENHILGFKHKIRTEIKNFVRFLVVWITQESTRENLSLCLAKVEAKHKPKMRIWRRRFVKNFIWKVKMEKRRRKTIHDVSNSQDTLTPILNRKLRMKKEGPDCFKKMSVFCCGVATQVVWCKMSLETKKKLRSSMVTKFKTFIIRNDLNRGLKLYLRKQDKSS